MTVYDLVAPVYGAWAALTEAKAHRRALAILRECPGEDLLEVAVGTGTEYVRLWADPDRRLCVGVDLSGSMLKRAWQRIGGAASRRALLCQADARALPFRDGSFDCLLSCYLIDLLPDSDIPIAVGEFRRVLRSDGLVVLVVMGQQIPFVQRAWMTLFRLTPALVGGCRPIHAAEWLRESGWSLTAREEITQNGFRSEVLVARVPADAR